MRVFSKYLPVFLFCALIGVLVFFFLVVPPSAPSVPSVVSVSASYVHLLVDFGDGHHEWFPHRSFVTGATVFDILKQAVFEKQWQFEYDPPGATGVFIRRIGEKKNGDDQKHWQYWVYPVRGSPPPAGPFGRASPVRDRSPQGDRSHASGRAVSNGTSAGEASNGVDAEFPMVAADRYVLKGGETVAWKFTEEQR